MPKASYKVSSLLLNEEVQLVHQEIVLKTVYKHKHFWKISEISEQADQNHEHSTIVTYMYIYYV